MVPRKRLLSLKSWPLLLVLSFGGAHAQDINKTSLSSEAVEGFDVVAYFTTGEPTMGSRAYALEYLGAVWRFASVENRDLFRANPQHYMPAFGGHCAYAMSKGVKADIHPYIFEINEGRLYLFTSFESRERFDADYAVQHAAADHWAVVSDLYF